MPPCRLWPGMASRAPARLAMMALIPRGAQPRWYHVLAIVGVCILVFAGGLGAVADFATGKVLLGVFALAIFVAGLVCGVLVRRSLQRTVTTT